MAPEKAEQYDLLPDGPSQGKKMSNKVWLARAAFALASFGILPWTSSASTAEPKVSPEDLRPGSIITYRDPGKTNAVELTRLEPTIALALKKGEAPHPRLRADGGTVHWQGYVNILRAGPYRFSAVLRGKLRVTVGGKEMLAAEVKADAPALKQGPEVRLEAGVHALTAEFTRFPGAARVELFWQAPHFHREPVSYDAVFHLPAQVPARVKADREVEHGRFLAEEHNCTACHRPGDSDRMAKTLTGRKGPDLSQVGKRVFAGWLYRWLDDPQKLRPGSPMPRMFPPDEDGKVERYAVARYLASLGGPLKPAAQKPPRKKQPPSTDRGKRLFTSVGCVACHQSESPRGKGPEAVRAFTGALANYPLAGLGEKTTAARLADYLEHPLAVDPSGRMPDMLLKRDEAVALAGYLCADAGAKASADLPEPPGKDRMLAAFKRVDSRAEELAAFQKLAADAQWKDLGKRLVIDKGCNNCHTIAPGGKGFATTLASASFDDIKAPKVRGQGCLATAAGKAGKAPWFALTAAARKALGRFLQEGTSGAGSPAPAYQARVALEQFNCLACHSRNGEGGLTPKLVEQLRRYEKADNAEAISPPPLTGVGHKLLTSWVKEVLTNRGRARPWMGLRMPQFGPANVGHLPEAFAALDGTTPENKEHRAPVSGAAIAAGRRLVGKQAFGCIGCHDIAGNVSTGTRGPDLALMSKRVRYDWYRRWLELAQAMQPGTRMPTVFPGGKSTLTEILKGDADAQAGAMWAYLSLGPTLPLPEGLDPPRGLVLRVKDRPVILRTFMPDAGSRAVAVGYPGGVAAAFDARTCRLAYAWSGNFLDASPVWDGRGGNPAKILGARFWNAPAGCPWAVQDGKEPPDFAARSLDPAYGADPGEGKVFQGKRRLFFEGYAVDKKGYPAFRYRLAVGESTSLKVTERPEPLRGSAGVGVARRFQLTVPKGQQCWLRAGEARADPRLLDKDGKPVALDVKSGKAEVTAHGRALVLPQDGGKAVVLALAQGPKEARWHLRRRGGVWEAVLLLPPPKDGAKLEVAVNVWAPYRDEPGLLKELVSMK
jgi:mono/diheme cytochrome c family protein